MMKYIQKGFAIQGIVALVALLLIVGAAYMVSKKELVAPVDNVVVDTTPVPDTTNDPKTYTDTKQGYSFQYPGKLSFGTASGSVALSHTIPFENRDGGCDMIGDAELSKTLTDFSVQFEVLAGDVKPPYVDGPYSAGQLNGNYAYMGAEGCGQTKYYFPVSGNRTLVVTKNELQVLSPVVSEEVRNQVLAVPGVISYEEANLLLKNILSSFKFSWTSSENTVENFTPKVGKVLITYPSGGETFKVGGKYVITFSNPNQGPNSSALTIALQSIASDGKVSQRILMQNYPGNATRFEWEVLARDIGQNVGTTYKIEVYPENSRELTGRSNSFTIAK